MTGAEIAAAGKAVEVVGKKVLSQDEKTHDQLLRAAEGTPEIRAAARSLARRIAVKERVKLKLYEPFARMLGVSQAYFEDVFPEEMAAKTAGIPDESMTTPPASVAVPALRGLSYTFDERVLKELYLNLLTTASDSRRSGDAHPAFAEVIKQLISDEAKLLHKALSEEVVPLARIKEADPDGVSYHRVIRHLVSITQSGKPVEDSRVPMWIDNWVRLGLIEATYLHYRTDESFYSWVVERPEYIRMSQNLGNGLSIQFDKGILRATDFGKQFFRAVSPPAEESPTSASEVP